MLPDSIYRILPYLYILAGIVCAMTVDSELVYISSVLLVFTGLLVLWMRYAGGARYHEVGSSTEKYVRDYDVSTPVKKERRHATETREFPLINSKGEIIAFDRRVGSS